MAGLSLREEMMQASKSDREGTSLIIGPRKRVARSFFSFSPFVCFSHRHLPVFTKVP